MKDRQDAAARAYAAMDEANAAYLKGNDTADEKLLRDAREGKVAADDRPPDLPPVEDLSPVDHAEVPPVRPEQTGLPSEEREERPPAGLVATADEMCRIWAKVRAQGLGSQGFLFPPMPKSAIVGTKAIADYIAAPVKIVDPTPEQQVADEVEITPGFWDVHRPLWLGYVEGFTLQGENAQAVEGFLETLTRRWPHGFCPDRPDRRSRAEQIRDVEREVEKAKRPRDRRRWHGAYHPKATS